MHSPSVPQRIFLTGFLFGFVLTLVVPFKNYLWNFQQVFYPQSMSAWLFGIIWGLIVAGFLSGGFAVLKNKGHKALIALVALVGLFYLIFSIALF